MKETRVHWNGQLVRAADATVSVLDTGFLYGDGVYETMRAYGGRAFALARHLDRIARSAARVELPLPPRADLERAVSETLAGNGLESAVLRITVTRGTLARRLDLSTASGPSVLVTADPIDPADDERRARGIRVAYSHWLRTAGNPLAGVKSTNYQVSLLARNEARESGADEVLVANESGDIVEAAAANVFVVERGGLVTPPLRSGILGGITREVVLELAGEAGLAVVEATLPRARLEAADEVFLTGTTIQVAPVVRIGDTPAGGGRPGPVALDLRARYLAAVAADTAEPDSTR